MKVKKIRNAITETVKSYDENKGFLRKVGLFKEPHSETFQNTLTALNTQLNTLDDDEDILEELPLYFSFNPLSNETAANLNAGAYLYQEDGKWFALMVDKDNQTETIEIPTELVDIPIPKKRNQLAPYPAILKNTRLSGYLNYFSETITPLGKIITTLEHAIKDPDVTRKTPHANILSKKKQDKAHIQALKQLLAFFNKSFQQNYLMIFTSNVSGKNIENQPLKILPNFKAVADALAKTKLKETETVGSKSDVRKISLSGKTHYAKRVSSFEEETNPGDRDLEKCEDAVTQVFVLNMLHHLLGPPQPEAFVFQTGHDFWVITEEVPHDPNKDTFAARFSEIFEHNEKLFELVAWLDKLDERLKYEDKPNEAEIKEKISELNDLSVEFNSEKLTKAIEENLKNSLSEFRELILSKTKQLKKNDLGLDPIHFMRLMILMKWLDEDDFSLKNIVISNDRAVFYDVDLTLTAFNNQVARRPGKSRHQSSLDGELTSDTLLYPSNFKPKFWLDTVNNYKPYPKSQFEVCINKKYLVKVLEQLSKKVSNAFDSAWFEQFTERTCLFENLNDWESSIASHIFSIEQNVKYRATMLSEPSEKPSLPQELDTLVTLKSLEIEQAVDNFVLVYQQHKTNHSLLATIAQCIEDENFSATAFNGTTLHWEAQTLQKTLGNRIEQKYALTLLSTQLNIQLSPSHGKTFRP